MNPKKNEKRATFINRGGDAHDWRMLNSFEFEFEPPEGMTVLVENKDDSIKMLVAGDVNDIQAASEFVAVLANNHEADADIQINSKGGSFDQGMMIFNAMKEHQGHITTTITGQAASTALTIAMGGDTIKAHENTSIMMHPAHATALLSFVGGTEEGVGMAGFAQEMVDKGTTQLVDLLAARSGQAKAKIEKMVNAKAGAGTTLTAAEALELGFVDEVIENKPRQQAASKTLVMQAWTERHMANATRLRLSGLTTSPN